MFKQFKRILWADEKAGLILVTVYLIDKLIGELSADQSEHSIHTTWHKPSNQNTVL